VENKLSGKFIKQLIKEKGLSQNYIAKEINVDKGQLSKYLNGKGSISKSKYYRLLQTLSIDF
jgi:transcriptional regulator with XRE-family HTH domain